MWVCVDLKRSSQNKKCFQYKQQQPIIRFCRMVCLAKKNVTQQHSRPACLLVSTINVRTVHTQLHMCVRACVFTYVYSAVQWCWCYCCCCRCCCHILYSAARLIRSASVIYVWAVQCVTTQRNSFDRLKSYNIIYIKRARNRFPIPFSDSSFEFFSLFFSFRTNSIATRWITENFPWNVQWL